MGDYQDSYYIDDPIAESDWNAIERQLIECGAIVKTGCETEMVQGNATGPAFLYLMRIEDRINQMRSLVDSYVSSSSADLETIKNLVKDTLERTKKIEAEIAPQQSNFINRKEYLKAKVAQQVKSRMYAGNTK